MIRLIQRRLIIPRGDTGSFTVPLLPTTGNVAAGDVAAFTIFDPRTHKKVFDKVLKNENIENGGWKIEFTHGDTVNLPVGQYVWDIKFYRNVSFDDNDSIINGDEVDSYYAAFSLPVCEIRPTGDRLLTSENSPTTTLAPAYLNMITVLMSAINSIKPTVDKLIEELGGNDWHIPTKISDLNDDVGYYIKPNTGIPSTDLNEDYVTFDDYANSNTSGVVKIGTSGGLYINPTTGVLSTNPAIANVIKVGTDDNKPLTSSNTDAIVYYGLAKAAGVDLRNDDNPIGTYNAAAQAAIRSMINTPAIEDLNNIDLSNYVQFNDYATVNVAGVVKIGTTGGLYVAPSTGVLQINWANSTVTREGVDSSKPITPSHQHESVFFGLAKAAGDTTQRSIYNSVGTYTDAAKDKIQNMLGISSLLAPSESTLVASKAYAVGDVFTANGKLYKVTTAIATAETIVVQNEGEEVSGHNAEECKVTDYAVHDVQINGVSILSNGTANIPIATQIIPGVLKVANGGGLTIKSDGLYTEAANATAIKNGIDAYRPITPGTQNNATFYGLAKAAGDITQFASSNAVGNYTDSAKSAIHTMLSGSVSISGTTPSITALPGIRYVCGEVSTLDITLPASGCIDVTFVSGSTPTALTMISPTSANVKWANEFDPTALEANTTYEIRVRDGQFASALAWA